MFSSISTLGFTRSFIERERPSHGRRKPNDSPEFGCWQASGDEAGTILVPGPMGRRRGKNYRYVAPDTSPQDMGRLIEI